MKRKWVRKVQYVSHVIPELDKKTLSYKPECVGHEAAQWIMGLLGHSSYEHKNGVFFIKGERLNGYGEFIKKVNEYRVKEGLPQFTKNPAWLHPEPAREPLNKPKGMNKDASPWSPYVPKKGRNNVYYEMIHSTGMNAKDFVKQCDVTYGGFIRFAKAGASPRDKNGEWLINFVRFAKVFGMTPEELEKKACAEQ